MKVLVLIVVTFTSALALAWSGSNQPENEEVLLRLDSPRYTCGIIRNTVLANGAVIIHYGSGLYEKVVASSWECSHSTSDMTDPFYAPTLDSSGCFVGYKCQNIDGQ